MSDVVLVLNSGSSCLNKIECGSASLRRMIRTHDKTCNSHTVVNALGPSEGRKQLEMLNKAHTLPVFKCLLLYVHGHTGTFLDNCTDMYYHRHLKQFPFE